MRVIIKTGVVLLLGAGAWLSAREAAQAVDAARLERMDPGADLAVTGEGLTSAQVRAGLRDAPLDGLLLRRMAQSGRFGDPAPLMVLAERVSRRDPVSQIWLIEAAVAAGDIPEALRHYDRALAVAPGTGQALLPILARNLEDPAVRAPLAAYAAREWFGRLIGGALRWGAPPEAVNSLIDEAAGQADPAKVAAWRRALVDGLIAAQRFELVRGFLQTDRRRGLATARGLGFGGAAVDPGNAPFHWQLGIAPGIDALPDGTDGLRITADSEREGLAARRLVMLATGAYALHITMAHEPGLEPAGASVRLVCARPGVPDPLPETALQPGRNTLALTIPDHCPAQTLSLAIRAAPTQAQSAVSLSALSLDQR
jgi:hypothetical protein